MALFRGMDGSDHLRWEPVARPVPGYEQERRSTRSGRLGTGTLACNRCDAPVALAGAASPSEVLSCPFCSHRAPLRDFLSLTQPSRPARVEIRVVAPPSGRALTRPRPGKRFSGSSSTSA
jgi:hypothetical protein